MWCSVGWNVPLANLSQLPCLCSPRFLKTPWLRVSTAQPPLNHQCVINAILVLNPNHRTTTASTTGKETTLSYLNPGECQVFGEPCLAVLSWHSAQKTGRFQIHNLLEFTVCLMLQFENGITLSNIKILSQTAQLYQQQIFLKCSVTCACRSLISPLTLMSI